jgi:parvulin-like peptidyl-prolyl isomerase
MNRALRTLSLVFAGVLLVVAAGCSTKDVAATVNGDKIYKTDINAQLEQLKKQYPQMFNGKDGKTRGDEFYKQLLGQAIEQLLVKQEAAKQGVNISDTDVEKQIAELKKGFPTEQAFNDALKQSGTTVDKLKEQMKNQLQSKALLDKQTKDLKISDAEMKAYYEKNKKTQFTEQAGTHAAHILFDAKDKTLAEKTLAEIKASPAQFAALAKKYSKDPGSAAKGGDLGWPSSPYVPEFQKALDSLKPGQLDQQLVKTQFGFHIIKVLEKRAASIRSYDAVKEQIRQILTQQKQADTYQKLLDQLKKQAKIEYAK